MFLLAVEHLEECPGLDAQHFQHVQDVLELQLQPPREQFVGAAAAGAEHLVDVLAGTPERLDQLIEQRNRTLHLFRPGFRLAQLLLLSRPASSLRRFALGLGRPTAFASSV